MATKPIYTGAQADLGTLARAIEEMQANGCGTAGNAMLTAAQAAAVVGGMPVARRMSPAQQGYQIFDPGNYSASYFGGKLGTHAVDTTNHRGASAGYKITVTGAGGRVDLGTTGFPLSTATSGLKNIGIWLHSDAAVPRSMTLYICNVVSSFTNAGSLTLGVVPGWAFYIMPRFAWAQSAAGTGFDWTATGITTIRVIPGGAGIGDLSTFQTGESLTIGGVYVNAPAKAKFMLNFDDGAAVLFKNTGVSIAGGDGATRAHSAASLVQSYGFPFTVYMIGSFVGTSTYATVDMLKAARDMGGVIGSHCNTLSTSAGFPSVDGNSGLRVLGPYGYAKAGAGYTWLGQPVVNNDTSIYAEVEAGISAMAALGFADTAGHFALPEGGYDSYVCSALDRTRVLTVRGVSMSRTGTPDNAHSLGYGIPGGVGGYIAQSTKHTVTSKKPWITTGIQCDGTKTIANITAYVDDVITNGAVGTGFTHSFNSTDQGSGETYATRLKALLAYLAANTATIEVVSVDDWYKTLPWNGFGLSKYE